MPKYSKRSKEKLNTCDQKLQDIFTEIIKHVDCTIITGHREKEEQNEMYRTGKSQLKYPKGKHNSDPLGLLTRLHIPLTGKTGKERLSSRAMLLALLECKVLLFDGAAIGTGTGR